MCSVLPFFCLLLAWTKGVWAMDTDMPFMEYLDHNHLVSLKWGFDDLQGNIKFKLVVNSTGWVGFGLSPNGGMKGSDIVIGGLGAAEQSYFTDRHATGNSMPLVDKQQNYSLLNMTEVNGQTIMIFERSIQACDNEDFDITAQPIKIIYAYGTTDEIGYHGTRRGTKEINLMKYRPRITPTNSTYFDAKVDNVIIPAITTYYHCKVMKFPKLNAKHHIYQIEPVLDYHFMVHHMLLYHCPSYVKETYDHPCYRGDMGDACFGVVASWGIGGGVYELPESVGIPVGGGASDIYRLEIHYNNPESKENITDSSGLRLYYTAQLRQHDVGILSLGLLPMDHLQYDIPPKADQFHTYGSCNTAYFSELVKPVPDLKVFAVFLHTHLAGRKVRVGHFRNTNRLSTYSIKLTRKQIDFLGLDENYDFEMQQAVSLGNIKTIKYGDEITIECTYSTANRTQITKLGLATTDEMCLAFLFYYPAIPIHTCISHPNTTYVSKMTKDKISVNNPSYTDIAAYETLLKTIPQIQMVIDDDYNFTFYTNGTINDLMKTPTTSCEKSNSSSRPRASWIVNPGGIIILLLWMAII